MMRRAADKNVWSPVVLPDLCPDCDGEVYLEWINLSSATKTQACRSCGLRFETSIEEHAAVYS